ncbi:MAG: sulfatase-like hydrolase/transferase [Chitinophagaceae bacterium]|nr:sulfatase-like hydrolase/transferase [Chitinophagaceae bacterium]
MGRVLDYLDKNNLSENTLVIYTGDQGMFLGENGWFDKRWMYDVSMNAPLLMRWPGKIKAGEYLQYSHTNYRLCTYHAGCCQYYPARFYARHKPDSTHNKRRKKH